jgi:hypothetical protein
MIKFDEHLGIRYMIDLDIEVGPNRVQCRHLPPFEFATVEECHAAIEAYDALPIVEHQVHLGQAEQFVYTRHAKTMFDLQTLLGTQFVSLKGEWVEVDVEPGYPTGSRKFQVRWPNNAYAPSPVLVITRGV